MFKYIMIIGKFTDELINKFIEEFKKESNQKKIRNEVIEPTIYYIFERFYPYIFLTCALFIILLIVVLSIFFILVKSFYLKK